MDPRLVMKNAVMAIFTLAVVCVAMLTGVVDLGIPQTVMYVIFGATIILGLAFWFLIKRIERENAAKHSKKGRKAKKH